MTRTTAQYFDGLLWPAAAGNVGWSVLTIGLADTPPSHREARLALLVLLTLYLSIEWIRRPDTMETKRKVFFGSLHIVSIAVLAIATAVDRSPEFLAWSLGVLLGVTSIGHAFRTWESSGQWWFAAANASGIVVLLVLTLLLPALPAAMWPVPSAALVVLLFWSGVRICRRQW